MPNLNPYEVFEQFSHLSEVKDHFVTPSFVKVLYLFHHQLGIIAYLQLISFHGVGKVKPSYDSFVLGLIIGGLKSKFECVFHVNPVWGGQNHTRTASWELEAPSMDNLQMGKSGTNCVVSMGCARVFEGVNFMMKYAKTYPLIAVLCLYLTSNSLSSMAHFISLSEVFGLCNICLIGCSIVISIV